MAKLAQRFEPIRRLAAVGATCGCLIGLASATYGVSLLRVTHWTEGTAYVLAGVGLVAFCILTYCQVVLLHKNVDTAYRVHDALLDALQSLKRQSDWLHTIAEHSSQSEWVKRVIYREKDYELLRDTIQSAIIRQDWAGAEHFIDDIRDEFGHREEAERLRAELLRARQATAEEKVQAALDRIEGLCDERKWAQAQQELQQLEELFPNEPRIVDLAQEIAQRRNDFKRELLTRYDAAVRAQDVEMAHGLLLELDQYLSPQEAAGLRHSARGVFRAKLHQLGVQFSLSITDKNFAQALEIGRSLVHEFPNTRYAQEIRSMWPTLERRAAQEAAEAHAAAGAA